MAQHSTAGESSAGAQSSLSASKDHADQSVYQTGSNECNWYHQAKRRRRDFQHQCIQPSGLADLRTSKSRIAAWLFLLNISEESVQNRATASKAKAVAANRGTSSSQASASSTPSSPSIVKDSLSSPIPLDKDGWQVASGDILGDSVASASDGKSHRAGRGNDEWKVMKSKKSRRKLAETTSDATPQGSSLAGQSSTSASESISAVTSPATSPNLDTGTESLMSPSLPPSKSEPLTDDQAYPNLSTRDIEQVAKDVERSFIGPAFKHLFASATSYEVFEDKALRRRQLSHLVLSALSAHPALHYFQGYHDILSVVLLTIAPTISSRSTKLFQDEMQQAQLECIAERMSLHVVRDSMTRDLLPIMGQLKVLGNLLRLVDPTMSELVDRASPVPFFALPWLLTLLTHDVEDVGIMQRVLEFVLAYGPGSAIYLCAAVLLARKEEVLSMDEDELEDPAMLHTILGRLPPITADEVAEENNETERQQEQSKKDKGTEAEDGDAIYSDPDVELPSLASDRALAASSNASEEGAEKEGKRRSGLPISSLLSKAVELMERIPLDSGDLAADNIMGAKSVLFTWSQAFDPPSSDLTDAASVEGEEEAVDWSRLNASAEDILQGPTDDIVISPHPDPPEPSDWDDEKHPPFPPPQGGKKRQEWEQARVLAVVGISGLLVAALFTASQNPSSAAAQAANMGTEETKRVLALVVSLLSNWGRVVGTN